MYLLVSQVTEKLEDKRNTYDSLGLDANSEPLDPGQLKFPKTAWSRKKNTSTGPSGPVNIWGYYQC